MSRAKRKGAASQPEPRQGDVWRLREGAETEVLVTTAWAGVVLTRTMESHGVFAKCSECGDSTGTHLSETEQAHQLKDFLAEYEHVSTPPFARRRGST